MNIKAAQEKLLALGYKLPRFGADGAARVGGETYVALEAFLRDHVPMDLGTDGRLSAGDELDRVIAALEVWPLPEKKLEDWSRDAARFSGHLKGVDPRLQALVAQVAEGPVAFRVIEGVRTPKRQAELVARGASKTLKSYHLLQSDGFGHAIDLAPWVDGEISWHWPEFFPLAREVILAATRIGLSGDLTWGAIWDRRVVQLDPDKLEEAVADYGAQVRSVGKKPFIDGPHWQVRLP